MSENRAGLRLQIPEREAPGAHAAQPGTGGGDTRQGPRPNENGQVFSPAPARPSKELANADLPIVEPTSPAVARGEGPSIGKFAASLTKGLSKAVGGGANVKTPSAATAEGPKTDKKADPAGKKPGSAKTAPDEPKDGSDLRVVYPQDPHAASVYVDIVAIHDVDETLQRAWIYRNKRGKRRANDPAHASGGVNSHDGEGGSRNAASPAPGRYKLRPPPRTTAKNAPDDSKRFVEQWVKDSAKLKDTAKRRQELDQEQVSRNLSIAEILEGDGGPGPSISGEEEEQVEFSMLGGLPSVPEDNDGLAEVRAPDDPSSLRPPRIRRRPTLPNEKRKAAGRFATIAEEEKVSSVGEAGLGRRYNVDAFSDRQSSLNMEKRASVNWLSDSDMLPSEIPGARIMCYTYKSSERLPSPSEYLTNRAEDLIKRLVQKRKSDSVDYSQVPIIFVGLGFGALILQRVMCLLMNLSWTVDTKNKDENTHPGLIAGFILLDAPSPGLSLPTTDRFPKSTSQKMKKTWTQDWLAPWRDTTKISTMPLWDHFLNNAHVCEIDTTWHYAPDVSVPYPVPPGARVPLSNFGYHRTRLLVTVPSSPSR